VFQAAGASYCIRQYALKREDWWNSNTVAPLWWGAFGQHPLFQFWNGKEDRKRWS